MEFIGLICLVQKAFLWEVSAGLLVVQTILNQVLRPLSLAIPCIILATWSGGGIILPLPAEDRNMERTKWLEAERDAALKKVAELTECLRWYVENDDTNEGGKWDESNAHWIAGKRRAQRALGMEEE